MFYTSTLDERTGHLIIARIMHGGVADRCGCFNVGDRLIELNGVDVHGKQPADIVKTLNTCQGTIMFKIVPAMSRATSALLNKIYSPLFDSTKMLVRALFDYDPTSDLMNPCPEAGLKFNRGEILEIVDSSDNLWWQATLLCSLEDDTNPRNQTSNNVGLVPSKSFLQQQKIPIDRATTLNGSYENEVLPPKSPKLKRLQLENADVDKFYEDIVHMYPDSRFKRPVVLIGPSGVGRNELKRRLILLNPDRFATTVPYTSRKARPDETDGVQYNFVSRAIMEQWMNENRFLEYGEYKGNLYGTTLDNIQRISTDLNRICILTPHSQAIRVIRNSDYKPFIVFVKPPSLEILKITRQNNGIALFTDVELEKMVEDTRKLEKRYKIYFDYTLVNDFLDSTFEKLLKLSIDIEIKPQWVPKAWIS
uniref:MAGUK p55 subfamily member 7 n=1 Tax=Romanomermis culicivorax TaxID=13658 RepID=A0A915KC41_ROMCU